ncbi:hypothetical protein BDV40DRAFT_306746 [Aspergillus tamarii]|uniref:Uncharacterized protein n=1 Tax=Aspergillus tamarii TaxID=41984 RepID=A0A5N6UAV6_ASPTM|nr:hypothetical protein BDV40DRAFT_306746 [Aspergillus tamarii]
MEIEKAVQFTLGALTLKEKSLAEDLLDNEQYDSKVECVGLQHPSPFWSSNISNINIKAWRRAPLLKLTEAISQARKKAREQNFIAKFIRLYCDTLIIEEGTKLTPEFEDGSPTFLNVEIYARKIVPPAEPFHVQFVEQSKMTFWVPSLALFPISFKYELVNKKTGEYTLTNQPGHSGLEVRSKRREEKLLVKPLLAPRTAMENINYMDRINENGTLKDRGYKNDDLPRLIQFQILVAEAHASSNKDLALALLDFVIAMTGNERAFRLNFQARALRSGLTVDMHTMNVPSVNIYSSKQVLKSRLVAALAFENSFRDFLLEAGNRTVQSAMAFDALQKSQDAIELYEELFKKKNEEYDAATKANEMAEKKSNAINDEMKKAKKNFEEGIKEFELQKKQEAAAKAVEGILDVIFAVGSALATGGASAGSIGGTVKKVREAVKEAEGTLKKLKEIFEVLAKLYDKIKVIFEGLRKIRETIDALVKAISESNDGKSANIQLPDIKGIDVFNATAEWRIFDITVRGMEDTMSEFDISGKNEYFQALKKMVVYGETYIQTQANVVNKGVERSTLQLQQKMSGKDKTRLSAAATRVAHDKGVLDLLTRAMFDRVLTIRHQVYFDFHTFTEAYRYHTLSDKPILSLNPVKPIVDYLDDMAKLHGDIASFSSKVIVQERTFKLRTLGQFKTEKELADAISKGELISVNVAQSEQLWNGFGRIRLSCARCWLEGVKTNSDLPIRLQLGSDGQFFDRNPADEIPAVIDTGLYEDVVFYNLLHNPPPSPIKRYVGDARMIVFEYKPRANSIVCDGMYGQERDYTKYTPMTRWSIQVVENDSDTAKLNQIDFSQFQGIVMEFVCDVTWFGL